jgi:DNA-directed RNA polymerase specialized sigma24 family protein
MSPLLLRRYRADRLLHEEFERLRERVIATVDERLRRCSVALDRSDLEAAYGQAWHGLHAAVLEGQSIASPAGWLIVATQRRALDEHRARKGAVPIALRDGTASSARRDLAEEIDDRARLRALLEALRGRLSEREQQAAALCYLQGLSRAEAAVWMGISESRMRKLMDGAGSGLRGVAGKVGEFVRAIAGGEWCEEQGSLMRGLAFGILDPRGDRHRLALDHSNACPACRAYVLSLRGLAAALPPLPALLRPIFAGPAAAAAGGVTTGAGGAAPAASAGTALGGAALPASGAAGAGAAGGGWWLAGPLGAKLAAGCMLALGVGAGCVALDGPSSAVSRGAQHEHRAAHVATARKTGASEAPASSAPASAGVIRPLAGSVANTTPMAASTRATREFGPERSGAPAAGGPPAAGVAPTARAAATASTSSRRGSSSATTAAPAPASTAEAASAPAAAQREFSPG